MIVPMWNSFANQIADGTVLFDSFTNNVQTNHMMNRIEDNESVTKFKNSMIDTWHDIGKT